ncbi:PREDICTED: uncharacterized protein LOC105566168 [Vollenhovia emeryi]|uniref:uncharacterized protein LOC105566168 n=1 Tax=Vollenhovia emeryi TaxID=411798 RepID=UPI0005F494B0|nr:PREDICTED: uncharacterized protein LOC105566168 [Vollenhovia emeryi]
MERMQSILSQSLMHREPGKSQFVSRTTHAGSGVFIKHVQYSLFVWNTTAHWYIFRLMHETPCFTQSLHNAKNRILSRMCTLGKSFRIDSNSAGKLSEKQLKASPLYFLVSECQLFLPELVNTIVKSLVAYESRLVLCWTATMRFTTEEYTDMIVAYGLAGESKRAAARIYAERFPERAHSTKDTIFRVVKRLRETGCLVHKTKDVPVRRGVPDEERVLDMFYENPGTSVRRAAHELGLSRYAVHQTLRENRLHPFHYQRVQQLLPRDFQQRINFCEGLLLFNIYGTLINVE